MPAYAGIHDLSKLLEILDSCLRRNDKNMSCQAFYEFIFVGLVKLVTFYNFLNNRDIVFRFA